MSVKRIAIVGGGAAGLVASIVASRKGSEVYIFERLDRVGKKILATGNGRCNITNVNTDITRFHGKDTEFANGALKQFDVSATIEFFEKLGVKCKVEDGGKVYPYSEQASSVLDVLRYEAERLGVVELCGYYVNQIRQKKGGFEIIIKDKESMMVDQIIIATGGKASPNLGSNGSGYDLVMPFGHKIIETFPTLVQLKLDATFLKALKGVKFEGAVTLGLGNKALQTENGEILYTDYGISGPPIFQLSRKAGEQIAEGKKPWLTVDMFCDFQYGELIEILKKRMDNGCEKPLDFSFVGLINKRLIPILLKAAGIVDIHKHCKEVSEEELKNICHKLKMWKFEVIGTQSWTEAQVTAGGIDIKDVNPNTMESKLVKGLYFAGEILDIDGDCGGFNLQWAWSSGYIAGKYASQ